MTLPSSGPLTFANIQTEFGGSNPISLSEYYAGGAYVPSGTTGTYGAVPTSGAISVRNFYGTSKTVLSIPTATQTSSTTAYVSWAEANAGFSMGRDGSGTTSGKYYAYNTTSSGGAYTELGTWVTPGSSAALFEAMATTVSQSGAQTDTGNFGTWQGFLGGGGPLWYISPSFYNTPVSRTITITVRNASTLATVGSFNVDISSVWYNY